MARWVSSTGFARPDPSQGEFFGNLVTTRVRGVRESLLTIKLYKRSIQKGLNEGHRDAMNYLLREIKKITPIDKGALRKSGKVIAGEYGFTGGGGYLKRGYIVFTEYYAVYVHEDLTKYHKPPTSAKFIERIVNDPRHQLRAAQLTAAKGRKYL